MIELWRYEAPEGVWHYVTRDPATIKRPGEHMYALTEAEWQQARPFQEDGHLVQIESDRARLLSVIRRLIEDDEWRLSLRNGLRADDLLLAAIDLGIDT